MKKYFCNYNQSLALKELGFDEDCLAYYQKNKKLKIEKIGLNKQDFATNSTCYSITAPLRSQVFQWFREKHGLQGNAIIAETNCGFKIQYLSDYINQWFAGYRSYEKAESACIDKLMELVKKK